MCSTSTKRVERAHPRSRGDHSCFVAGESQCSGSSPLARGPLRLRVLRGSMRGLIPARAGNTILSPRASARGGAHPRSRGEHAFAARVTVGVWAHPRSRGEHCRAMCQAMRARGSSPLARGTLRRPRIASTRIRLIPARAGNTIAVVLALDEIGAHPRSRGEHESYGEMSAREAGSSPLARGTRGGVCPRGSLHRAHPRSRGEHMRIFYAAFPVVGSSPLARGTHCPGGYLPRARGLIPARAGNTILSPKASAEIGAHPRSRGEHILALHHLIAPHGSSPLARGTQSPAACTLYSAGLIPARAGNTLRV